MFRPDLAATAKRAAAARRLACLGGFHSPASYLRSDQISDVGSPSLMSGLTALASPRLRCSATTTSPSWRKSCALRVK